MTNLPVAPYIMQHATGWRRPLPGMTESLPRADISGLQIAPFVDPRSRMQPVDDQGQIGDCTADATCNYFRFDAILDGKDPGPLSRLWTYRYERIREGTFLQGDVGAMGHDAFIVAQHGIPSETLWPYDIATYQNAPSRAAITHRAYRLTKQVHTPVQTVEAFKAVLSNNQLIAYGFTVYPSYEQIGSDGVYNGPASYEQPAGGHEQLIVGYLLDYPDHALLRGSWSDQFALGGYILFPWELLMDPNMCSDFRTIARPL